MKVVWKEQFKEGFKHLEKRLKNPQPLRKAMNKAIFALQTGKDLSRLFTVNRVVAAGEGWYDCYLSADIVMIYRVYGQRIILTEIGFAKELVH